MSGSTTSYAEAWLKGPSQTLFYTRTYVPEHANPKAVLVFIHGFAEHVGRYTHFHPRITQRDIAVFAIDQRGFGLTGQDEAKRSKGSSYGKTCWADQMGDIAWAVGHAKETFKDVPLFLMGHSMGGAEVLGFATTSQSPHVSSITAVIATSPLILQTHPAPKLVKWIGSKASALAPYALIPAPVKAEDLSHDKALNDAYLKDPLIKQSGTLKGISDMLTQGEALLSKHYKTWPRSLPVLIVHGTADQVTSVKASQAFHDTISAADKKIVLFEGGYHELQNEPDGVKEKLVNEIVQFIDSHLPQPTATSTAAEPASAPEGQQAKL